MTGHSSNRWIAEEFFVLDKLYPIAGADFVKRYLPHRSLNAIRAVANRRGLLPRWWGESSPRVLTIEKIEATVAAVRREIADEMHPPKAGVFLLAAARLRCAPGTISTRLSKEHSKRVAAARARKAAQAEQEISP